MDLLKAYKFLYLIRKTEETLLELISSGRILGTTHACIGQESVAVGSMLAKRDGDVVFSNHRGHGHMLACGLSVKGFFHELFGLKSGICGGIGGSQHIMDSSIGFIGSNGITGGQVPLAVGYALGLKLKNKNNKAIVFFGDGALNQGVVSESFNMAAVYNCPIIFICENNKYGMSAASSKFVSGVATERARSFGIKSFKVVGKDVENVYNTVNTSLNIDGPVFIEAVTYRFCGHSKSDMNLYRPKDEILNEKTLNDPISICKDKLLCLGVSSDVILDIESNIDKEISLAIEVGNIND